MACRTSQTLRANLDIKTNAKLAKVAAVSISSLQEQIRRLQTSMEDLVSPSESSKSNSKSPSPSTSPSPIPSPDDTSVSRPTILPGPSTPLETTSPSISDPEHKPSYLYTYTGPSSSHLVSACHHCAPGEVLISEALLEDMQAKTCSMAQRGHKAVQGRMGALQELSVATKQNLQMVKTLANTNKSLKAAESNLRKGARKAEKAHGMAEHVNADMLTHWNTALWEVATLKARVKELEGRVERGISASKIAEGEASAPKTRAEAAEKDAASRIQPLEQQNSVHLAATNELQCQTDHANAARTAAEIEVVALKLHLTVAEDTATTLTQELSNAQNLLYITKRHHETEMKQEVDTRIPIAETLLIRLQSADGQSRFSVDTNGRPEAKFQGLASDNGRLRDMCAAFRAARNEDTDGLDALASRNAYLEERLSVYEETRSTLSAGTVSFADDISTVSTGQGQGWGFRSLRGLRSRKADEEERIY